MDIIRIQQLLSIKFSKDHSRVARMSHFMGLLKTAVDGMATLGVVLRVEVETHDLEALPVPAAPIDPLTSLDLAIAHMQRASTHATHEEGHQDQIRDGADIRG